LPMSERRCCLITGPTHGIGRVTVERLSEQGYDVLLACRDVELGKTVAKAIAGGAQVFHCDLARWDTVAQMTSDVLSRYSRLDLLINNAGFIDLDGMRVGDYPAMMAVNHLGPYLLTTRLFDLVTSTPGSRIINVASHAHRSATIEFDDPLCTRSPASGMMAYGHC
jgi:NAD(P)-dependent dehydrogenase (short-subunit alcohol dehydrogenase family)